MILNVPSTSSDEVLQDRFNRQLDEAIAEQQDRIKDLEDRLAYVKAIPSSLTTVAEIVTYLQGV